MNKTAIRVLAIEDNPDDAELIRIMLNRVRVPSFSFVHAQQLSEGLRYLREGDFDIVLLDLRLPDSEGIDVVLGIKKQSPNMPIIVLTGLEDEEIAVKLLHLDVQDYLTKGQIDSNLLARSIRYSIERKRTVEALQSSEARFRRLSESGIIGIAYFDSDGRITEANDAFLMMFGYSREDLTAGRVRRWGRLVPREWMPHMLEAAEAFKTTGRITPYETEYVNRNRSKFWGLFGAAKLEGKSEGIAFIVDITERKKLEEDIRHMAQHDVLTGLPNRRLFMEIIRYELLEAHRNKKRTALLFVDLDHFKEVNDTLGHEAGDELLKTVAGRLKASIRESDVVARIGGDEFNILLSDITRTEDIATIAEKILDSFKDPCLISGQKFHITTSIGVSVYPDDSSEMDTLFRYADMALYHAKERGRSNYQFYNPRINIRSVEKLRFASFLRQTLRRGELTVHYQPLIDIRTRKIVCAEALVRWKHPELGLLESKRFIPTAESIGFIAAIDEWVLRSACGQLKSWLDAGYPPLCVTVNLSSRVFQHEDFVATVSRILDETGLPPHYLEIEITESIVMVDIERTIACLNELARKGIRISIDDFGTGYSSLNYLKRLPIQKLKIDQSFIKDIATDPDDRAIISAVTAMAHTMKMSVVAEGVESEDQLLFLTESQCDEAQGYFFNEPVPPERFSELIAAGAPGRR